MAAPNVGFPPQGIHGKLWVVSALPFNATTAHCMEFDGEGLSSEEQQYHPEAIRGTRKRPREKRRIAGYAVGGSLTLTPTKSDWRFWLPRIFGTAETGAGSAGDKYTYILSEVVLEFQSLIQKVLGSLDTHPAEIFLYEGCVVDSATISAAQNGPVRLTLNLEAKRETSYANGSITTGNIDTGNVLSAGANVPSSDPSNESCFMLYDSHGSGNGSMEIGGAEREVMEWSVTINNLVDKGRWMNSLYRSRMPSQGLDVQMSVTAAFSRYEAELLTASINDDSPDMNDNIIRFYNELGSNDDVLEFQVGTWNPIKRTPVVGSRGETLLNLAGPVDRKNTTTVRDMIAATIWTT